MKTIKIFLAALVACSLAACSLQNEPSNGNGQGTDTSKVIKKSGKFSVSENHKVVFSLGNLRYEAGEWSFAKEQYLYLGYDNDATDWTNAPHDLFAHGQTGYNLSALTDLTYKVPDVYAGYNQTSKKREQPAGTNWDWGIFCAITNGGYQAGLWRTLTMEEWNYLLTERKNADKLKMPAMVAGKRGYLLLPDDYRNPGGVTAPDPESSYVVGDNTYCYEDWKQMEEAGAVFLPCAGIYLINTDGHTYYPEFCGYYWTMTNNLSTGAGQCASYAVQFGYKQGGTQNLAISIQNKVNCYDRCAVRLVQEAE